jgi:hypothetical protein
MQTSVNRRYGLDRGGRVARTTNPKTKVGALPSVCEGGAFSSTSSHPATLQIHKIDLYYSCFALRIKRKTAPRARGHAPILF